MEELNINTRRSFLIATGPLALLVPARLARAAAEKESVKDEKEKGEKEEEEELVTPGEDLMREHGILNRVLLVYEECIRRMETASDLDPKIIPGAAEIIRTFIEDYHEELEEDFVFPRLRESGPLQQTVQVLLEQHQAGRRVTDAINAVASAGLKQEDDRRQATSLLRQFIRMYRPHEAREDTVIFPALQQMMKPEAYAALGEDFEGREHQLFGEGGFHEWVDRVAQLEKMLGLYDLSQYTPSSAAPGGH